MSERRHCQVREILPLVCKMDSASTKVTWGRSTHAAKLFPHFPRHQPGSARSPSTCPTSALASRKLCNIMVLAFRVPASGNPDWTCPEGPQRQGDQFHMTRRPALKLGETSLQTLLLPLANPARPDTRCRVSTRTQNRAVMACALPKDASFRS
jgi:hypothetical protein